VKENEKCCTQAILSEMNKDVSFPPCHLMPPTVDPVTITLYIGIWCTDFFKAIFVPYLMPPKTGA